MNPLTELRAMMEAHRVARLAMANCHSACLRAMDESHTAVGYAEMKKADDIYEVAADTLSGCEFELLNAAIEHLPAMLAVTEKAEALCANAGVSTLKGDMIPHEVVDELRDALQLLRGSE